VFIFFLRKSMFEYVGVASYIDLFKKLSGIFRS
jgi:hypothetical protein